MTDGWKRYALERKASSIFSMAISPTLGGCGANGYRGGSERELRRPWLRLSPIRAAHKRQLPSAPTAPTGGRWGVAQPDAKPGVVGHELAPRHASLGIRHALRFAHASSAPAAVACIPASLPAAPAPPAAPSATRPYRCRRPTPAARPHRRRGGFGAASGRSSGQARNRHGCSANLRQLTMIVHDCRQGAPVQPQDD